MLNWNGSSLQKRQTNIKLTQHLLFLPHPIHVSTAHLASSASAAAVGQSHPAPVSTLHTRGARLPSLQGGIPCATGQMATDVEIMPAAATVTHATQNTDIK